MQHYATYPVQTYQAETAWPTAVAFFSHDSYYRFAVTDLLQMAKLHGKSWQQMRDSISICYALCSVCCHCLLYC